MPGNRLLRQFTLQKYIFHYTILKYRIGYSCGADLKPIFGCPILKHQTRYCGIANCERDCAKLHDFIEALHEESSSTGKFLS